MELKRSSDGIPLCPDCLVELNPKSSNGRDTETMGGYDVQYYSCENCGDEWEVIDGKRIYPLS